MDTNLLVESRESGDWSVVEVKGEVDLYTAPQLREELTGLAEGGRTRIVVDLAGVDFLDSTGLGVLIVGLKRCREQDGALALVGPTEPVQKVLSITGLDKVFPIHGSVEQATGS
ncbi:MAG: STAS domain-containing protein [Actinomycetota bacterium]